MSLTTSQMATIAAIGSALVPLVVSFLKREHWSAGIKQLLAFVVSAVVACAGLAVVTPHWTAMNVASLVGLAYTGSQLVYQTYFRGSAFDTVLTGLLAKPAPAAGPPVTISGPTGPARPLSDAFMPRSVGPNAVGGLVTKPTISVVGEPSQPAPAPQQPGEPPEPAYNPSIRRTISDAPTGPDGRPVAVVR